MLNKRKIKLALLILGMTASTMSLANSVCERNYGILRCGPGTIDAVDFMGLVSVNGTTVTDSFRVLGNVEIKSATINQMHVRGTTQVQDSSISGDLNNLGEVDAKNVNVLSPVKIIGNLFGNHLTFTSAVKIIGTTTCDKCTFQDKSIFIGRITMNNTEVKQPITITIRDATFTRSKLSDIHVKKSTSDYYQPTIRLNTNSIAHNIDFEGLNGVVILSGNSKITGTVKGGKIVTS